LLESNKNKKKLQTLEDRLVWKVILDGNKTGLSLLFKRYYRHLLNYGKKFVKDEDLVKDCIQDLFFNIWRNRDNLSEIEYVKSYLLISFRRRLFELMEKQKNRMERNLTYLDHSFEEYLDIEKIIINEELSSKQKKEFKKSLENLDKRQREALFLKFYSGLSSDEVAEVMDITRQSVYNYISKAVERIQNYLGINSN